jgi:hypothetical protein
LQEFLGTLVIVVTSEGLVRVDDRKNRGFSGDCESDSNKYEDFFSWPHPLKNGSLNHITAAQVFVTGIAENYALLYAKKSGAGTGVNLARGAPNLKFGRTKKGKGRGEASGEKRVLIAAETAISNPLIETEIDT